MKGSIVFVGWRTVVVNKICKLSYKNGHLVIRSDNLQMIHLSEINLIIIENGMVSITSYLINELVHQKIKIIFCDERHNPSSEVMPYYGSYNTSKKIFNQINWLNIRKEKVWQQIVKYKIYNQAMILKKIENNSYKKLLEYVKQVEINDQTNREGHAAKVYFNALFGKEFTRDNPDNINAALDYGYSILLAMLNKEVVSKGYITQLGIKHKNEFNEFNLSCDLMEIFRPLIDEIVYKNKEKVFDKDFKYKLIDVGNKKIIIDNKEQYLSNAIPIFIKEVFEFLENKEVIILNYEF